MTNNQEHITIGEIYREHGIKGLAKVYIYSGSMDQVDNKAAFILEKDGEKMTDVHMLKVSSLGRQFLVQFDCFDNSDDVVKWRKAKISCLRENMNIDDQTILDQDWEGFVLLNDQGLKLGTIKKVVYTPLKQFQVLANDEEKLVPVVDDWIISRDTDKKEIVMDLPEGLI
jgi:16S rRNA processing protein RimM